MSTTRSPCANQAIGISRAADLLAGLMQPGVVRLRRAVLLRHLEAGERNRPCFVGDVDQPQERRRRRAETHDVFVRHQHDAAAAQRKRHRQRGMGRPRKRRAPVEAGDEFRLGHVVDVENDEAAVPIAGVEAIAETDRMMAAVVRALPGRRFRRRRSIGPASTSGRLPPGVAGFWKSMIDDDVAEIAVEFRRAVDVAAVEREPVHAARRPGGDAASDSTEC